MKKFLVSSVIMAGLISPFKASATLGIGSGTSQHDGLAVMWEGSRGLAPAGGVATISSITNASINGQTVPEGTLIYGSLNNIKSYYIWTGSVWEKLSKDSSASSLSFSGGLKLENSVVTIPNDSITGNHIADRAIDSAHIKNGVIGYEKLDISSTNVNMTDSVVVVNADGSFSLAKSSTLATATEYENGLLKEVASSGSQRDTVRVLISTEADAGLEIDSSDDGLAIKDLGIQNAKIANGAVDSAKIASAAVDSIHIRASAVYRGHIASDAIDSARVASGEVKGVHIASQAVDSAHIALSSIDGPMLDTPEALTAVDSNNENNLFILAVDTTSSGGNNFVAISPATFAGGGTASRLSARVAADNYQEAIQACWAMSDAEAVTTGQTASNVISSADRDGWRLATVKELTELFYQRTTDTGVNWNATPSYAPAGNYPTTAGNYFTADPSYHTMMDAEGHSGYLGTFCFNDGSYNSNYEAGYMQDIDGGGTMMMTPFFISPYGSILMSNESKTAVNAYSGSSFNRDLDGDLKIDNSENTYSCSREYFRCVK